MRTSGDDDRIRRSDEAIAPASFERAVEPAPRADALASAASSTGPVVLVVGAGADLVADVLEGLPDARLRILETDDDAIEPSGLATGRVEVRRAEFRRGVDAFDAALEWYAESPFDVVIAGRDEAVEAAEEIAAWFGLPRPGPLAATLCTDAFLLRTRAQRRGLVQGRFAPVRSAADVRHFVDDGPIVLKPRRRRPGTGGTGVVRIDPHDDVEAIWDAFTSATGAADTGATGEPIDPVDEPGFMVQDLVRADAEVSIETVVRDGEVVGTHLVEKLMPQSGGFAPTAHLAPARLDPADVERLLDANDRLLELLRFGSGVVHAEWIRNARGVHLVGCSARGPGDRIGRLVGLTTGAGLGTELVNALAGRSPTPRPTTATHAASTFFETDERLDVDRARAGLANLPWVCESVFDVAGRPERDAPDEDVDAAPRAPGRRDAETPRVSGTAATDPDPAPARVGHAVLVADSCEELRERLWRVSTVVADATSPAVCVNSTVEAPCVEVWPDRRSAGSAA